MGSQDEQTSLVVRRQPRSGQSPLPPREAALAQRGLGGHDGERGLGLATSCWGAGAVRPTREDRGRRGQRCGCPFWELAREWRRVSNHGCGEAVPWRTSAAATPAQLQGTTGPWTCVCRAGDTVAQLGKSATRARVPGMLGNCERGRRQELPGGQGAGRRSGTRGICGDCTCLSLRVSTPGGWACPAGASDACLETQNEGEEVPLPVSELTF